MTETILEIFGPRFQMWVLFGIILWALVLYAVERYPMEITSLGVVCVLLTFFHFFPVTGADGANRLSVVRILKGFANPALITVLALLVLGQGMVRTGVLDRGARLLLWLGGGMGWLSIAIILVAAAVISAFLNNIPVVVIFIPIMQVLAVRFRLSPAKVMIPLSFAAVLGGMTTLIGSGTNLLVNSALIEIGREPFGFFDFTVPGAFLAGVGLIYLFFVAPRLLPERKSMAEDLYGGHGQQFMAQITVTEDSDLVGRRAQGGMLGGIPPDLVVRSVQRGEAAFVPPFEDYTAAAGDVLVVAATRKALTEALSGDPGLFYPDLRDGVEPGSDDDHRWHSGDRMLAEVMITPASRLMGRTLARAGFRYQTNCIVMAIKRRSHMIRSRITDLYLRAGDELLVLGQEDDIRALRSNQDVVVVGSSEEEIPAVHHARRASLIFLAVIILASSNVIPIVVAALAGAGAMVATGVLTVRQATRAIDPLIVATIGTALALGISLQETGGAAYLAHALVTALKGVSPAVMLSLFFLLVAVVSNIISTKTTAVLFTPIAVDIAVELGVSPEAFVVSIIFAANSSFASPLGYQTNLLVMGPGHYRFLDFTRVGAPLILVLWAAFSLFVPWYYGI